MKKTLVEFPDTFSFFFFSFVHKPLLITSLGSVGGNQLTKIKGHRCQQVEQLDTYTHKYINHSVHNYILTQLSLKGTQLQPQSQCYFHLTFNIYLVAVIKFYILLAYLFICL